MNLFLLTVIFLFLSGTVHGSDEKALMKKEIKDAKKWAEGTIPDVLKGVEEKAVSEDDLLPEKDKGKKFHSQENPQSFKNIGTIEEENDFQKFLEGSDKKESFEGSEDFFRLSRIVAEDPDSQLEIVSTETNVIPAEERLFTCEELGSYQVAFTQKKVVTVTDEIKNAIKHCHGHKNTKKYFWEKEAKEKVSKEKKRLSKDSELESFDAYIDEGGYFKDYHVVSKWKHRDGVSCDKNWIEEIVVQPYAEKDSWVSEHPEVLSRIEANPNCRLLYARVLEGAGTRSIKGKSIYRDTWEQQLFFSCGSYEESPCVKLRQAGGSVIKKKCLKTTDFGECELWQKTYEMGKKASYQIDTRKFATDEISGLDGHDTSYEMNGDFGEVLTTLTVFSNLKKEIEDSETDFHAGNARIFKGDVYTCLRSFLGGDIFDCCKRMDGLAVKSYLVKCNASEVSLSEKRQEGKCHYVGTKKLNFGAQTAQVFCCFPTKLDRIIQEEGRSQLKIEWGSADKPNCQGFTLDQLKTINFSTMDLSEFVDDFQVDKEKMSKKIRDTISKVQNDEKAALSKTQEIARKQENRGVDDGQ